MKARTLAEIATIIEVTGNFEGSVSSYDADSRSIKEKGLFFALKGERVDGHDFLKEVAEKKAVGAVVAKDYKGENFGLQLLYVDDVVAALQKLAKAVFSKRRGKVVAVTGSVGKTTTKEFISTLLESKFRLAKSPGNFNSQVTMPLSILNSDENVQVTVLELAMSEPGQIAKLVQIAPPDIGVMTKIGVSHAEFFKDGIEGIATAKAEIFSHPKTRVAIINGESAQFSAVQNLKMEKIYYGWSNPNYNYIIKPSLDGIVIDEHGKRSPSIHLPFQASHLVENFCAAAVVARKLGMSWDEIARQALKLKPFKRRFERIEKEGIIFINDSYNASPESMRAALSNLPILGVGKKKIAVFGEMKELGMYADSAHIQIAEFALSHVDHLLCFGKGCLPMVDIFAGKNKPAEFFHDMAELRARLYALAKRGDLVLLKGSNSNALWKLVEE